MNVKQLFPRTYLILYFPSIFQAQGLGITYFVYNCAVYFDVGG